MIVSAQEQLWMLAVICVGIAYFVLAKIFDKKER
jgi:hypothetical protein